MSKEYIVKRTIFLVLLLAVLVTTVKVGASSHSQVVREITPWWPSKWGDE